jgi:CelD/BcsL family acetyltransferase involved in cellulose biosynthesis
LRIREVSCADADLESALDDLFALHGARWAETGSPFLDHAAFHRDVARIAAARGWLRLVFLEDDGRPVAASYGFRYEGAELDYQGGRDPEWTGGSPGLALLAWMVRAAFEAGICNYRLLRGGEWYKTRFATHDRGVETFAVGHGALGTAAAAAAAHLPSSVSGPLRQRLRA